jgi:hypothetical protein
VRDRAAASLVIVFGQQIEDVVRLTWNEVMVTNEHEDCGSDPTNHCAGTIKHTRCSA